MTQNAQHFGPFAKALSIMRGEDLQDAVYNLQEAVTEALESDTSVRAACSTVNKAVMQGFIGPIISFNDFNLEQSLHAQAQRAQQIELAHAEQTTGLEAQLSASASLVASLRAQLSESSSSVASLEAQLSALSSSAASVEATSMRLIAAKGEAFDMERQVSLLEKQLDTTDAEKVALRRKISILTLELENDRTLSKGLLDYVEAFAGHLDADVSATAKLEEAVAAVWGKLAADSVKQVALRQSHFATLQTECNEPPFADAVETLELPGWV